MAERPDAVEIDQGAEVATFLPSAVIWRKRAYRAIVKIGVPRANPTSIAITVPEGPSARRYAGTIGNSDEENGFSIKFGKHRTRHEKPYPSFVNVGPQRGIRLTQGRHLAFVRGTK